MMRLNVKVAVLLLCAVAGVAVAQQVREAGPRDSIDWPTFLGRQDLVWTRLPARWGESAFIGNGLVGATIDSEGGAFGWTINRTDVVHDASRFPIGKVVLRTAGHVTGGDARLTLWDAEASGTVRTDRGDIRWRSFVPREPHVIVIVLTGSGGERSPAVAWLPAEARPPRKVHNKLPFDSTDLHPPAVVDRSSNEITSVQTFLGGDAHAESIRRIAGDGNEGVYVVGIGYAKSGSAALAQARAFTASAARRGVQRLTSAHRAWWHAWYPKSFVSFPDERLESYYWIQMYKLASAMRADGPILDLNGPWFHDTPWPAIWWNLNIQLTYSPLFKANRMDLAESLFRNLDRGRRALEANVPERLRGQAAAIGRSSGPDLVRKVDLATAQSDAAHEMGDLPWTLYYYWEYYRDSMDDRILRDRVYPLLRLAIGNYLGYVEKGADGKYHLPPTESPELTTVSDASYDIALLRWGLQSLIASADRLHIREPLLPRWRDVLANLTPLASDSTGLWVGRDRPWRQSHRHYSHLLAIYPLGLITPETPGGEQLIAASLRTWEREPSLFRGYSFTGGASMHAMLGQGDSALSRLNAFLDFPKYMEPNTFYAEAGPVIETPLSAAATIQELFLQDWGGALRVFPAVPSQWQDASFADLRGDGAFLVSGVRHAGHTSWVRVTSLAGQPCRVVVRDWTSAVVRAHSGPRPRLVVESPGRFRLTLAAGASVVLAPDATLPLAAMAPVSAPDSARNPWPDLPRDSVGARAAQTPRANAVQDAGDMAWWRESMKTRDARLAWWRDARFGMFIHWGVYSQLGGVWNGQPVRGYAEHIQRIRRIPEAVYVDSAVKHFNPTGFDADEWVRTARRAGMRYMIITAKHHDGFAMYDSKVSPYNIVAATPFARDPLRELRDAARRRGVKFGFYYSHAFDWQDPDAPGNDWERDNPGGDRKLHGAEWWHEDTAFLARAHRYVDRKAIPQILELIRNYDPDIMWFDTPSKLPPEENLRILRAARAAKPDLVINGRAVQDIPGAPEAHFGDYASTADRPAELTRHGGDWEAIPTTNESYGYHRADRSHKPPAYFVRLLAKAAARGGNVLLNIGPMGNGRFDPADSTILAAIGDWMFVNAASIRGTTRTPLPPQQWGESTRRGDRLYLHVFDWPRDGRLRVAGLSANVKDAFLLAEPNLPLGVHRDGPRDVIIDVPRAPTDPWDSVIALDCDAPLQSGSAMYVASAGDPTALHVFDGSLFGPGIRYGDGKRNHDVTEQWSSTDGGVEWPIRFSHPARVRVALDYSARATDGGTFALDLGDQQLVGRVIPTGSDTNFRTMDVGETNVRAGELRLAVRPTLVSGTRLMRLRRVIITPLPTSDSATLTRDALVRLERARVLAAAERFLRDTIRTITSFPAPRSAGGLHDYFSEGDYWWPDPRNPSGPFVQRDGETNPDNFVAHRDALRLMSQAVPALVAAYEITHDERFAARAVEQLRAWFVDERTRMNPNLLYAQAIHGRATGRGIGIIDTIHLVEVAQAIRVLERMGYLTGATEADVKSWFREYLTWLTTHPYGLAERNNGNNHSVSWALQVAEFAKLVGDSARLDSTRIFFKSTLVPTQMALDGSFPRELARTKPYGYSLFQLDLMSTLAEVLSTPDDDLWAFTLADGRGMRRALEFMYPYIADRRSWFKPKDVMYDDQWPKRQPSLFFGGRALDEPKYLALWQTLDADPAVDEVVRNFPIRQPLLWVE